MNTNHVKHAAAIIAALLCPVAASANQKIDPIHDSFGEYWWCVTKVAKRANSPSRTVESAILAGKIACSSRRDAFLLSIGDMTSFGWPNELRDRARQALWMEKAYQGLLARRLRYEREQDAPNQ